MKDLSENQQNIRKTMTAAGASIAADVLVIILLTLVALIGNAGTAYADDDYITKDGFPDSYLEKLEKLHEQHPTWKFTPVKTGLKWKDAVAKMTANPRVNTIWYSYTPAYKSTAEGYYDYLQDSYSGGSFPAASEKAVKFFMDPRNFLDERNVFLFEDRTYHSYQKTSIVKKILRRNEVLHGQAKTFVSAGKKYDISPMYLASKSFAELGTSDFMMNGHKFTYGGVKYKNCYNAYNIGSSDTLGPVGGLIYANGGKASKNYAAGPHTSYGRKWDSPEKAIRGGARYLNSSFIKNNQATAYTEHFNVLNGLSAVGTHVYMTSLNGGISIAGQISSKYSDYGIFEKPLEFYIPVYKKMPSKPCGRPSTSKKKDNNCYLKKLYVKYTVPESDGESKKTVTKKYIKTSKLNYKTSFKLIVPANVEKVKITADAACQPSSKKKGATVAGNGTFELAEGKNELIVVCKASTGLKRNYKITVTRE
ncbi:MAG: hypothetical protein IKF07_07565 [Eubacterium sp.]|nr:hypothetical protein [Eubacterium sp.]